jgi:hypothetical protein
VKFLFIFLTAHLVVGVADCPDTSELNEVTEVYNAFYNGSNREIASLGTIPFEAIRAASNSESLIVANNLSPDQYDIFIHCENASYYISWTLKPDFVDSTDVDDFTFTYVYSSDGNTLLFVAPQ